MTGGEASTNVYQTNQPAPLSIEYALTRYYTSSVPVNPVSSCSSSLIVLLAIDTQLDSPSLIHFL